MAEMHAWHPCRVLGNISYPLSASHYPFMYLFYAHIGFHGDLVSIARLSETWPAATAILIGCPLLALALYHFYDMPVRNGLTY